MGCAAAFGFAAAFFAAGLALVGASAAAFAAALGAAFGFVAALGFAVPDFGAPFAPAFGAALRAAGLRVLVPAARVRAVRVELGAAAPVLVPPARVGASAVAVGVTVSSSLSRRKRPVASETTLRPRSTTPEMMSLGVRAMVSTV